MTEFAREELRCVCGLLLAMIGLDVLKQVIAELVSGAREIAIDFRVHGRRVVVHFGDAAGVLRSSVACDEGGSKIVLDDERQVERPAVND